MNQMLTKEGAEKLQNELTQLKTVTRKEVIERIATAKEHGDLKENAEYHQAKDDQAAIESRIAEVEHILKNATIVDEKQVSHEEIGVGSSFTVNMNGNSTQFKIVGPEEVDPNANKISYESPLGKSFLGKKKGEKVTLKVPAGEFEYHIEKIH